MITAALALALAPAAKEAPPPPGTEPTIAAVQSFFDPMAPKIAAPEPGGSIDRKRLIAMLEDRMRDDLQITVGHLRGTGPECFLGYCPLLDSNNVSDRAEIAVITFRTFLISGLYGDVGWGNHPLPDNRHTTRADVVWINWSACHIRPQLPTIMFCGQRYETASVPPPPYFALLHVGSGSVKRIDLKFDSREAFDRFK